MSEAERTVVIHWRGVAFVWVLSLLVTVGTGVLAPPSLSFSVLTAAAALMVSVAFFVQMIGGTANGYINRVAASLAGAFAIFAIGGGIISLVAALAG